MKFATGCALAATAVMGIGLASRAEDEKAPETQAKKIEESSSSSSEQLGHGKKKATKHRQLSRGGGPVGDEGTRASKSMRSTDAASPDDSLGPGATEQKVTKERQIERGAGPEGTEGAAPERTNESTTPKDSSGIKSPLTNNPQR